METDGERAELAASKLTGTGRLGEELTELTMQDTGQWLALSETSAHFFDLDTPSVVRVPGFHAIEFVTDTGRPLRSIEMCRVGEAGHWTMEPFPFEQDLEYRWHISTRIVKIARVLGLERVQTGR